MNSTVSVLQSGNSPDHRSDLRSFLIDRLPSYVRSSSNLKSAAPTSYRREREAALSHQWISFNTKDFVNALTIDCDHDEWPHYLKRLREQGQPDPTFVIASPGTGTAHLTWLLSRHHGRGISKANRRQMRLYEGAYEGLRAALQGDPQFTQYLTKNPLHPAYEVVLFTGQEHQLSDILGPLIEWSGEKEYVLQPRIRAQFEGRQPGIFAVPKTVEEVVGAKGSRVWETGRQRCYRQRSADINVIIGILEEVAVELGSPIKPKALAGMAHRISRWMAAHPNMLGRPAAEFRDIDHGVMTREAEERGQGREWDKLDTTSKRMLAAERTNNVRMVGTVATITAAVTHLWASHEPITQPALASAAGLGIRTIERHWAKIVFDSLPVTRSNPFFALATEMAALSHEGKGTPFLSLKQISDLSKERAARASAEQAVIRLYRELAEAMWKRGAEPLPVPPRGPGASADVVAAHNEALAAHRDCLRRQNKRLENVAMKSRRQEKLGLFRGWAEAGDTKAYKGFLAAEAASWDKIEDRSAHDVREARERIRLRRGAAFKRHAADWNAALLYIEDRPPPRKRGFRTVVDNLDRIAIKAAAATPERPVAGTPPVPFASPAVPSFLRRRSHQHAGVEALLSGILSYR